MKEEETYQKPRRIYIVQERYVNLFKKAHGEAVPLVTGILSPENMSWHMKEVKEKVEESTEDDVLHAFATTEEAPYLLMAVIQLYLMHGRVKYIYHEPMWGKIVEGVIP